MSSLATKSLVAFRERKDRHARARVLVRLVGRTFPDGGSGENPPRWATPSAALVLACSTVACGDSLIESADNGDVPSFAHDLSAVSGGKGSPDIVPWPKGLITYAFDELNPSLPEGRFRLEVQAGFDEWSRVTENRVLFIEVAEPRSAQLVVGFRSGNHNGSESCLDQFSSPSQTIAHVFTYNRLCLAGAIHLNLDLAWVVDGSNIKGTYDVRYAILHEVGHVLGLGHIDEPGHIMHTEYIGVVRKLTEQEGQDAIAVLDGI